MAMHEDHIQIDPEVLFRRVGEDGVVVDQRKAEVTVMNGLGVRIMELIRETASVSQVLARLVDEYDAPEAEIASDLDEFIRNLIRHNFLAPTG